MMVASHAMPEPDRQSPLTRAMKAFQANMSGAGPAMTASYTLLGGILLLGGIGYVVDSRFGTSPAFVATGLVLGVVVGLYQLAKTLWRR
jgi:F0F1-type ATP synthase assembly protein I